MSKVAKVNIGEHKDKWLVHDAERGWIDADGKVVQPQASQRHTKYYAVVGHAKVEGFSPSAKQSDVIAKWEPAPKKSEAPAK